MALRGCRHGVSSAVRFRDVLPRSSSLGLLGCCRSDLWWTPTESGTDRASDWDRDDPCPTRVCSRFSSFVHEYSSMSTVARKRRIDCERVAVLIVDACALKRSNDRLSLFPHASDRAFIGRQISICPELFACQ
jgi:hypothetical protein